MLVYDEVSEEFYESHNSPVDMDVKGNMYILNSDADHLTWSKILYHPSVLAQKCALAEKIIAMRQ